MVGLNMPDDVLFSPDEWIGVVEKRNPIVGEDHVSLGSDFDGGPTPPRGMHDISRSADAHRRHAPPRLDRGAHPQVPRAATCLRVFRQITER